MDAYQAIMEEHILRKNKGLPTEHPLEVIYKEKTEAAYLRSLDRNDESIEAVGEQAAHEP